ncbi:MAG: M15 family metallopeptidase, partial [Bacteroidota bacterium]
FFFLFQFINGPFTVAYPSTVKEIKENQMVFQSGKTLLYDDHKAKSAQELLDNPDIEDQLHYAYNRGESRYNTDAGRIRNDAFFKELYGKTAKDVQANLTSVIWCPTLVHQKIQFSTINGANLALEKVSAELDQHPEWKAYLTNIGGTFNWRLISGTQRLSAHAFGITIDINTSYTNYWQWDCDCKNEDAPLGYKNRIPMGIVEVFEKHGFIWGGRWKHYDTMHFEYRPEFFVP